MGWERILKMLLLNIWMRMRRENDNRCQKPTTLLRLQNRRNQSTLQMQRRHRDLEKTVILWWVAISMKMISSARIKQRFGFVIFVSLPPVLRDFSASVPWPLWWLDFFGSGHIYGHGLEISKSAQTVLFSQLEVQVLKWVSTTKAT